LIVSDLVAQVLTDIKLTADFGIPIFQWGWGGIDRHRKVRIDQARVNEFARQVDLGKIGGNGDVGLATDGQDLACLNQNDAVFDLSPVAYD
jgi:hypothetical protein